MISHHFTQIQHNYTFTNYKYEVPCDLSSTDQSEPANFHHHS